MMAGRHAGRHGQRWQRLRAQLRAERRRCWLCGQRIDYSLPGDHPNGFTIDHIRPLSLYPAGAEDYANLAAAHRACNLQRGDRDPNAGLGTPSREW